MYNKPEFQKTSQLAHQEEMLKLMKFLTGNEKFDNIISVEKGGPTTMFDAFEAAEKRGEARGEAIGEARGKEIGETRLANLLQKLYSLGRTDDVQKAINDKNYRDTLMKELAIQ